MSILKSPALLFYDDLAVGQIFHTAAVDITATDIVDFAARYDPQPFHLDEAAARQSLFGGLVASGWMTAALTMGLLVRSEMKLAGGLIGLGLDSLHWPHAVKPGDCLRAATEVLALRPSASKPAYGIVKLRTTTRNQAGEIVQVMVANQLVLRRSNGAIPQAEATDIGLRD
jgi:acyl dehydratase